MWTLSGNLFDTWLSQHMNPSDRVLNVLCARFWLSFWRDHIVGLAEEFPDLYSTSRSFISSQSFHIFNRLCDSMVLLVLAYAKFYPDIPFCPWLLGTEFIEHFFGLARTLLPDFTYAELVKMVQNVMVRQCLLLTDRFREKQRNDSAAGYVMDHDPSPLMADEVHSARVALTPQDVTLLVELSFREASQICKEILKISTPNLANGPLKLISVGAPKVGTSAQKAQEPDDLPSSGPDDCDDDREDDLTSIVLDEVDHVVTPEKAAADVMIYSALCDDFEEGIEELGRLSQLQQPRSTIPTDRPHGSGIGLSELPHSTADSFKSLILLGDGKLSIDLMLGARQQWESHTKVHSERTQGIYSKFSNSLTRTLDSIDPKLRMSHQEASHRVRVAQQSLGAQDEFRKARELRWQQFSKAVQGIIKRNGT